VASSLGTPLALDDPRILSSFPYNLPGFIQDGDDLSILVSANRGIFESQVKQIQGNRGRGREHWELFCKAIKLGTDPAKMHPTALATFLIGRFPPLFRLDSLPGTQEWESGSWSSITSSPAPGKGKSTKPDFGKGSVSGKGRGKSSSSGKVDDRY